MPFASSLGVSIFIFFALAFSASKSFAQTQARMEGILINADSSDRDYETGVVTLVGNVQAVFKSYSLKADKAIIRLNSKEVDATGNVVIVTQQATVAGERVVLNYDTQLGTIYEGYVQAGPALFEGQVIYKVGENDYIAERADYTACTTCPAAWSFSGRNIKAELGGYAYIKNSFFRVGGIPVLWLPYLIVPLKSTRQSGLLTPEFENSKSGGFTMSESYFWAISRSQDATLTLKNYDYRGLKTLVNYRYVLSDSSNGEFDAASLPDRVFAKEGRLNTFRSKQKQDTITDRWFAKYNHYYILPNDYISRARLNFVSDLQYPKDFPKELNVHGDPAIDNRVSLTKNTDIFHASIDTSYYTNLLQSNPMANNENAVHRFPEIKLATSELKVFDSDFLFNFDFDYVNFSRGNFNHDDISTTASGYKYPTNECKFVDKDGKAKETSDTSSTNFDKYSECRLIQDGKYNAGDFIRTGQRLDFEPSLSRPFKLGPYLDIVPKTTFRETHYHFNIEDDTVTRDDDATAIRRYIRNELSVSTSTSAIYGDTSSPIATRYKHEIQPKISVSQIPWMENPTHPFWGNQKDVSFSRSETITDQDFQGPNGLQFDYNDRLYNRNIVTLGINNKLTERRWNSGKVGYQQIAFWSLSQSYDAYLAKESPTRAWSDIESLLQAKFNNLETSTLINYYPRQQVSKISSKVGLRNNRGNWIELGLSQNYAIQPEERYVNHATRTEDFTFKTGLVTKYIDLVAKIVYDANWKNREKPNRIKEWAYYATLKAPGNCWDILFSQEKVTDGDITYNVSFAFLFDGTHKTGFSNNVFDKTSN